MINITKLYCGVDTPGDHLRYKNIPPNDKKPVIAWNITKKCNLKCVHCYSDSLNKQYEGELTTAEAKKALDGFADYKVPVVLFSGGEPLKRDDIFELAGHAKNLGLRYALSTNGTLIDKETALKIKEAGFSYAGISLDGMQETNDLFRGCGGAFKKAVAAFSSCAQVGQKAGLRFTLTKYNFKELDKIFDFLEEHNIPRACFYHLVPAGRGTDTSKTQLTHDETRNCLDTILARTKDLIARSIFKDILTVDNHADGVYVYMKLKNENPALSEKTLELLKINGGGASSTGVGIACVNHKGDVHPDQFWRSCVLGNIKETSFEKIWTNLNNPILAGLKNRLPLLKGRCARCNWLGVCGGGLRSRAANYYGDPWAEDPGCYLTDEELNNK